MNVDIQSETATLTCRPTDAGTPQGLDNARGRATTPVLRGSWDSAIGSVVEQYQRFPRVPNGIPRGLSQNFKTSNGSLKTLATLIRGRLWKVCFLGPNPTSPGFLAIPKDSEGDS